MQSRIPLSIVLSAEGKRHTIPHCTYRVPVHTTRGASPESAAQQREGLAFFRYLDSNDTRLPSHPHLSAYAQPAEEYETYVGEDVWECESAKKTKLPTAGAAVASEAPQQDSTPPHTSDPLGDGETLAPVPGFYSVVSWVDRVFEEQSWAGSGVVLCGRYVVADDGAWVVPSRSPSLYTTREVFLLMRNSCKFLQDIHMQMAAMTAAGAAAASSTYLEFTLAKSLAGSGASEMRAILPYPIHYSRRTRTWVTEDTAASLSFTGIGQRMTDACFPSLMAWSEEEHDEHFRRMQRRVEQAALLEHTCEVDPDFISRLVARFHKRRSGTAPSRSAAGGIYDSTRQRAARGEGEEEEHLTLLLTVDLLFEGPSLPIYVLSAKARVFEVVQRSDAAWDAAFSTTTPWTLWTPLLKNKQTGDVLGEGEGEATAAVAAAASVGASPASSAAERVSSRGNSDSETEMDEEDQDEYDDDDDAASTLNFFRMFRDVEHWNQYVVAMVQRLHDAATDSMGCPELNKPSRNVQHYCVIASESGDLVTCGDTLTKRGLPLELVHPELLELNEDAAAFLKMLRDGLFKKPGNGG